MEVTDNKNALIHKNLSIHFTKDIKDNEFPPLLDGDIGHEVDNPGVDIDALQRHGDLLIQEMKDEAAGDRAAGDNVLERHSDELGFFISREDNFLGLKKRLEQS